MNFAQVLAELLEDAKNNKETASDSNTARHWAIVRTDLEKLYAYHLVYLDGTGNIVEGGSE